MVGSVRQQKVNYRNEFILLFYHEIKEKFKSIAIIQQHPHSYIFYSKKRVIYIKN